jgi:phage baseplate assembly protein gpV
MAVTALNLLAGPGVLYQAAFGATEPADSAVNTTPSASTHTDVGGTNDGVKINITQEYFALDVDQVVDVPGRRLSKRDLQVETNLAEPTLANLTLVLNEPASTITASAAYSTFDPSNTNAATQPTYKSLLFDGWAPGASAGGFNRRVIVRKVLSLEGTEPMYKKDDQTVFKVTFGAHYVSSTVRPFRVIDQTA